MGDTMANNHHELSRRTFLGAAGSMAAIPVLSGVLVNCAALHETTLHKTMKVKPMNIDQAIQQNLEDYIHQGIFPIIQAEAVSKKKSPEQMSPVAEKVRGIMAQYGIENLQILQEAGSYPAVYGEVRSPNPHAPTILIQGHYDGQPSDPKKWTKTKPHEPKVIPESGERRIYGRGSSDDWGQVMTHLAAVDVHQKSGTPLPANVKFLIEGGEERGSIDMDKLILKYKNLLACDVVMITDSAPGRENHSVITTMTRGLVAAYVTLQAGTNNPHSGENLALNAVAQLAVLLTSMKDYQHNQILIPGFYDAVHALNSAERAKFTAMPFDTNLFKREYGLKDIITEQGYSAQETMWARPSFEIHTIIGGEKVNSIPTHAEAYITMRLVPHQNPQSILELFTKGLYQRAAQFHLTATQLTITPEALASPFSTTTEHPAFKAAERAMEAAFSSSVDYLGCGGTEPIAVYHQQILKVPVIFNAYNSPRDHYHGNDESFSIENSFLPGIKANVLFYRNMTEVR